MPTYKYKCKDEECNHSIETTQKITEDPLVFCPHCGKETFRRVPTISSFILKGKGWYKNTIKPSDNDP